MLLLTKYGVKVKRILFKILVLLLPVQLSKHFWPSWSYIFGIRLDYLSPVVYLTDILLFLLLSFWFIEKITKTKPLETFYKKRKTILAAVTILLFSALNIAGAQSSQSALFEWLKLLEMIALTLFVVENREIITRESLFYPLSIATIYTAAIGVTQFFLQRTIGGPFYYLGERTFSSSTPGIALGTYFGSQLLRPYATFPHPNALAGFLVVSFLIFKDKKAENLVDKVVKSLAAVCFLLLLFLSNSQGAWLVFLTCGFIYLLSKYRAILARKAVFFLVILATILSLVSPIFFQKVSSENTHLSEGVERRISLAISSGKMIAERPVFGVGLNNFLVALSQKGTRFDSAWFLQPVHNIYLLVFAEAGLFGLFLFVYILTKALRNLYEKNKGVSFLMLSLLAIVLTGLFDHYWLTLQQTQLLFSIVLGFSLRKDG